MIGLGITTEDHHPAHRELTPSELEVQIGLAITTDEPDLYDELHHTYNHRTEPVSFQSDSTVVNSSPTPIKRKPTSFQSDSTVEVLSPQQQALRSLTSYDPLTGVSHAAPVTIPQPSYFSPLSPAFPYSGQEERYLLPSGISPVRPADSHALELSSRRSSSVVDGQSDFDDEDDYSNGPKQLHLNTRRDPRERLGVYNPTPPTPIAMMHEENRRKLQQLKTKRKVRALMVGVRRMVLFQIAFFVVQMLASLSIIINVAQNRMTSFGTQHVALLLAAWGPGALYAGAQLMAKLAPSPLASPTT